MEGPLAVTQVPSSPLLNENLLLRQKLGFNLTKSILGQIHANTSTNAAITTSGNISVPVNTSRCLFGAPDTKSSKNLVKEVELKNALKFGKRFNFDIVNGEPFPSVAKRMKTQEHQENENEGYTWGESYNQDFMAACNKYNASVTISGPNRQSVSLFYAPILTVNIVTTSASSSSTSTSKSTPNSSQSTPVTSTTPKSEVISEPESEPNNNNILKASSNPHHHHHHHHDHININNKMKPRSNSKALKCKRSKSKSKLPKAYNNILAKYAHLILRKPRKSFITDYLSLNRVKKGKNKLVKEVDFVNDECELVEIKKGGPISE